MTDADNVGISFSNTLITADSGCAVSISTSGPFSPTATLQTDINGQIAFFLSCLNGGAGGAILEQNGSGTGQSTLSVQFENI
jgi:hypothetical protein